MNSPFLQNIIIGIGIASIFFALLDMFRGGEFMDALPGIVIGAALIGSAIFRQNKNKRDE